MPGANTTTQVGGYGGSGGAGGDLLSTNNLSDVASAATSRTNLGFSTLTDYVTLTGTQTLTNKTLTTPKISAIHGSNAHTVINNNDAGSAVNYWDVFNSNTGAGLTIRGGGTDTNITASFYGKGAGETNFGISTAAATNIYGLTVNSYTTNGTLNLTTAGVLGLGTATASTNSVVNVESRSLTTSGTAATGLGLSKTSYIEIAGGSASLAATESVYLTDGTSGAANVLWTLDAGSSNINAFEILGASGVKMGGSTSGYVTVKPSAVAGDYTLTLPVDDGTSGYVLSTNGSGVTSWVAQSGGGGAGGVGSSVVVYKSADETVTSSTALQNDDELLFAIGANEVWAGSILFIIDANASGGFKYDFAIPSGASGSMRGVGDADIATPNISITTAVGGTGALLNTALFTLTFTVSNGATPGNVQFRWAQNASFGTGSIVKAGTLLTAVRKT